MSLTRQQYGYLCEPLHPSRVRMLDGNSHLEAWDVRRTLIRVFGFGGYDVETLELSLVAQHEHAPGTIKRRNGSTNDRTAWTVIYRAQVRLIVKDERGREIAHFDDGATGDAVNQPSLGDAHDQASKTALSQALKRCAVNLGDQFGMSLYNNGTTNPVVLRSLVTPIADQGTVRPEDAPAVEGGELDEQVPDMAAPPAPAQAAPEPSGAPTPDSLRAAIKTAAAVAGVDLRHIADRWQSDYDESIKDATDVEALQLVLDNLDRLVKA